MEQSPKSLVMATYLVFCPAVESGEALLDSLGVSDEEQIKALLENRNLIAEIIQPFWGTYYDPYTQYSDDESEKDFKPELERLISRLNEIIEQIFQRLSTVFGNNVSIGEAEKAWRKVVALYNLRMKSPYVRLSCKEQERYRDIILEIIEKIASCADGLVNEPKEDSKETSELQECEKIIKGVLEGISASPIPVKVDGFTEQGVNTQEKIIQKLVRKKKTGGSRNNQIDQAQVAKDFGVSRQTVVRWEKNENPNGPTNKSNPWGYYSDLRKNPDLRGAYLMLVDDVKKYNMYKEQCKKKCEPLITFVQYKETWAKHNKKFGGA